MALSFGTRIKFLLGHIWLSISSKVIRGPSSLVLPSLPSLVSILLPMVFNKSVFAPTRASLGVYTNFWPVKWFSKNWRANWIPTSSLQVEDLNEDQFQFQWQTRLESWIKALQPVEEASENKTLNDIKGSSQNSLPFKDFKLSSENLREPLNSMNASNWWQYAKI